MRRGPNGFPRGGHILPGRAGLQRRRRSSEWPGLLPGANRKESTVKSRLSRPRASRGRREPFGKAGLILAVCALVLACTGGAFAAGRLTGPPKKEVGKIAAKVA